MTKEDIREEWIKYCNDNKLFYDNDFEDLRANLKWLENKIIQMDKERIKEI
jgi:hypothetical protein